MTSCGLCSAAVGQLWHALHELARLASKAARCAELARTGAHSQAWKMFCKLRSHRANLNYNVYHYVMTACLKVRPVGHALPRH
jgi:hypothetical protein